MELQRLATPNLIFPDLPGSTGERVLRELAERMKESGIVDDADTLYQKLEEREALGSTAIGHGVAVPHCKLRRLDRVVLAVATSRQGVEFAAVDGQLVRLFFLVLSPEKEPAAHLHSLAAISKWVKVDRHVERILECRETASVFELLGEEGREGT